MSRVQLALRVPDLAASIAFYSKLFGAEPAKVRDGYANFALSEPPLKLVLIEGAAGEETRMDHLGVEVETPGAVNDAAGRLREAGLAAFEEHDTACCYALQDKVWVHGPGKEPWEVYVVKADAGTLTKQQGSTCCSSADGPPEKPRRTGAAGPGRRRSELLLTSEGRPGGRRRPAPGPRGEASPSVAGTFAGLQARRSIRTCEVCALHISLTG